VRFSEKKGRNAPQVWFADYTFAGPQVRIIPVPINRDSMIRRTSPQRKSCNFLKYLQNNELNWTSPSKYK